MATKQSTKKSTKTTSKTTVKKTSSPKKPAASKAPVSQKVDFYPNRMTVAVSALAGSVLVLFAVIAVLGSR